MRLGIGESGVSQSCRRVAEKIEQDKKLKRRIAGLEERINSSGMKICPLFFSTKWDPFVILHFSHWNLFEICDLEVVILIRGLR
jgi:hypothetical protein